MPLGGELYATCTRTPVSSSLPREVLVAAVVAGCACKKIVCVRLDLDQLSDHAKEDACVKGLQMLHPRGHCS